ncbi:MAG: hypothetical protein L0L22_13565 [Staphylococcus equorum]|nr:hypothetical protein [Staphylococcus equorum]
MSLEELLGKVDILSVEKNQKRNYENFINFLDKNEIENVYSYNSEGLKLPFDKKLEEVKLEPPLTPITSCNAEEMSKRLQKSFDIVMAKQEKEKANNGKKVKARNKTISKLRDDINKKNKELDEKFKQNEELTLKIQNIENSKSWKLTKPLRNLGKNG